MARALVVFESMFGNNALLAAAIDAGISTRMVADTYEVGHAPTVVDPDVVLVVVGGPTHMLGLSRPSSRARAAKDAGDAAVSKGIGLREWLAALGPSPGTAAAAFDTRLARPWFLRFLDHGSRDLEKGLRRLGFRMAVPSANFYVAKQDGPLLEGEQERARLWAADLAARVGVEGQQMARPV